MNRLKNLLSASKVVVPVAGVTSAALLLSACGPAANIVESPLLPKATNLPKTVGTVGSLDGLPSDAPGDGFTGGGGGLTGDVWTVWGLPGSRSSTDPGIPKTTAPVLGTISLRPKFTALPGQGSYEFKVQDFGGTTTIWDSQDAGSNSDCTVNDSEASCTLPANLVGSLKNGSTYRLVTAAGNVTTDRLFAIQVMPGPSGNQAAQIPGRQYSGAGASMQVAMAFNNADQGPTPGTAVTDGPRWGLPAGWKWTGPISGMLSLNRSLNAAEYAGYSQLLTIKGEGLHQTLGCQTTTAPAAVCGQLATDVIGGGLAAVIGADSSVVVTDQASGQNWTFNADNQLVSQAAPGMAPIDYTYRTLTGATDQVLSTLTIPATGWTWTFMYSGDTGCQDTGLPTSLSAAPSGYTCGWQEPSGDRVFVYYSQPGGATVPRISRTIQTPAACPTWAACDASQLGLFDLGWNSSNQLSHQRGESTINAAILNNISATDKDYWASLTYDDLGRLATSTPGKSIDGVDLATTTYSYTTAKAEWAPATREISASIAVGDGDPLTGTIAVDDAGRTQFQQAADGVVTQKVWDADKPLMYGTVESTTSVVGQSYDQFGRGTSSATGTQQAFDLTTCAPNAANRSSSSCMPNSTTANPALQQHNRTYDEAAGTGNGLKALWYSNAQFSGNPVSTVEIDQSSSNGFAISPPSGISGKSAWGLRLSGSLVLPETATYNLDVEVPPNMFSATTVYVGSAICAVVPPGQAQATCTVDSKGGAYPVSIYLAHAANAASSGNVPVTIQSGRSTASSSNKNFIPTWSAVTTNASTDHNSSGNPIVATETYGYGNPITPAATTTTDLPMVVNGTSAGSGSLSWTSTYDPTSFGGSQAVKATNPGGNAATSTYWGMSDTPSSLPNASQIPAAYQSVPQHGLLKMQQQPGGRQQWYVHDQYGNLVCQADVMTGTDPAWSCYEMNDRGLLSATTARGQDGQTDLVTTYTYLFDSNPDNPPFVVQRTTTVDGNALTDESRRWLDGTVAQYIGADGSTTKRAYQSDGKLASLTTHVSLDGAAQIMSMGAAHSEVLKATQPTVQPGKGKKPATVAHQPAATSPPSSPSATPAPSESNSASQSSSASPTATNGGAGTTTLTLKYAYDSDNRLSTISDENRTLATINYNSDNPRQVDSYDYLDDSFSQQIQYDTYGRAAGTTWTLPDTTINGSLDTTAGGIIYSEKFAGLTQTYDYDGFGRLLRNTIQNGDTTSYFSYGWDSDGNRTCAAANIANSGNAACSTLPGASTFTYKNDLLTATSSPATALPAGSMLKDGSFSAVGDQTYQFDASRQLTNVSVTGVNPPAPPAPAPSPSTTSATPAPTSASATPTTPSSPPASHSASASATPSQSQTPQSDAGSLAASRDPLTATTGATKAGPTSGSATAKPTATSEPTQTHSPSQTPSSSSPTAPPTSATPTSPSPSPTQTPGTADPTASISFFRDAANRPLAQTTTKASGAKAGYTSVYTGFSGGASATVAGTDVTRQIGLPGGLLLQGETPIIHSIGSTAALALNSDGSQSQNQLQVWGPYGEPLATTPGSPAEGSPTGQGSGWRGTSSMLDNTLINLGARSYRTDLGMFLQTDPIMSGSSTMNDHAYVAGDPVNTSDLSGTSIWNSSERDALVNIVGCIGEMPILEASYKLVDFLPEGFWTGAKGLGGQMLLFTINAGVNYGLSMAISAALDNGEGMDTVTAHIAMVTAMLSGYCASVGTAGAYRGMSAIRRAMSSTGDGFVAAAKKIGNAIGAGMKEYADARAAGATVTSAVDQAGVATVSAATAEGLVGQTVAGALDQAAQVVTEGVRTVESAVTYGPAVARALTSDAIAGGQRMASNAASTATAWTGRTAWSATTYPFRAAWGGVRSAGSYAWSWVPGTG